MSADQRPDFRVVTVVYNDHIMRRMLELNFKHGNSASISQLVERMGYGFGSQKRSVEPEIRNIVGLKTPPADERGTWKPIALEIAAALGSRPEDLWPGQLKRKIPSQNSRALFASVGEDATWLIMGKR